MSRFRRASVTAAWNQISISFLHLTCGKHNLWPLRSSNRLDVILDLNVQKSLVEACSYRFFIRELSMQDFESWRHNHVFNKFCFVEFLLSIQKSFVHHKWLAFFIIIFNDAIKTISPSEFFDVINLLLFHLFFLKEDFLVLIRVIIAFWIRCWIIIIILTFIWIFR